MKAFVPLDRALDDHPVLEDAIALAVYVRISYRARYGDRDGAQRPPGHGGTIPVGIGQAVLGRSELANSIRVQGRPVGERAIRSALLRLVGWGLVALDPTKLGTIATVRDLSAFWGEVSAERPSTDPSMDPSKDRAWIQAPIQPPIQASVAGETKHRSKHGSTNRDRETERLETEKPVELLPSRVHAHAREPGLLAEGTQPRSSSNRAGLALRVWRLQEKLRGEIFGFEPAANPMPGQTSPIAVLLEEGWVEQQLETVLQAFAKLSREDPSQAHLFNGTLNWQPKVINIALGKATTPARAAARPKPAPSITEGYAPAPPADSYVGGHRV